MPNVTTEVNSTILGILMFLHGTTAPQGEISNDLSRLGSAHLAAKYALNVLVEPHEKCVWRHQKAEDASGAKRLYAHG
jgi:hypothetical protein